MTLDTKLNHEPLLNYLKERLPEAKPIADPCSPYFIHGQVLFHLFEEGQYDIRFGNMETIRTAEIHATKDSLGWYVADVRISKGRDARVLIFDFSKVGSKESYEFAMEHAAKHDDLEMAATFRDLMYQTSPHNTMPLFQKPKPSFWKQITAGILGGSLLAFGALTYINHKIESTVQKEQVSTKRYFWEHTNNLLQQGLNMTVPPGVRAETDVVTNHVGAANYTFSIKITDGQTSALTLLLDEKTGEWLNKTVEDQALVCQYGLESIIERLQQRVKDNYSAR